MLKLIGRTLAVTILVALGGAEAGAQDVLMNSAETINKGNLKLAVFPTVLLRKDGADQQWGWAGRVGIGLTKSLDVEAKGAIFDGLKYYGGDAEMWLVRSRDVDASVSVGLHRTDLENGPDSSGFDTALVLSAHVAPRLELYGGLKAAFDSYSDSDQHVTLAHGVPGLEYRITDDLDFLAEVGLALNDRSRSYFSVGLAFYLR